LKLLILSQYFWPENFTINELATSLSKKEIDVQVLTGQPNYPKGKIFSGYHAWSIDNTQYNQVPIVRIPIFPRGNSSWRLAINYISFVLSGVFIAPLLLRRKKIDVIFVYGCSPILQAIPAIFLGWLKGCPVVLWVQDLWPESLSATGHVQNKVVLHIVRSIVAWIYRHVTLLLVQSPAFVLPVQKLGRSTPVIYYPNSVDSCFAIQTVDQETGIPELGKDFSVLFAGNVGKAQGVKVIVEAATLLREHTQIHFIVLGDGSDKEWMQEEVRSKQLSNLHVLGHFPIESMPTIMQRASVLLVTLADYPIFAATIPNKVQAYLASGRPVIACLNGEGARLVVETGAGFAVPAEDSQALADTILKFAGLPSEELDKMGALGREYYLNNFNHDNLVDQLLTHLQFSIELRKSL